MTYSTRLWLLRAWVVLGSLPGLLWLASMLG